MANEEQLMQIGIPRGMSYYSIFPFMYGFFEYLGIKIILSDPTTKKTMNEGSSLVVTETCLPIKVYVGHILNLLEKGIDKIFIPSIQSIAPKIYNCSKIRGLPDLIKNVVKKNFCLVDPTFDKSEKGGGLYKFLMETAKYFGIHSFEKVKEASKAGRQVYNNFRVMLKSGMQYNKALKNAIEGKVMITNPSNPHPISIALISHPYNIYDEKISMKIFDKLEKLDVSVYSAEDLSLEKMKEGISALDANLYWANEYEMTGACGHYMQDSKIDGIITLTAFGCGPDSLMIERMIRNSKKFKKPLLHLTVDEQTGEAGFVTRLEAFVDMLYRKKRVSMINSTKQQTVLNK